MFCFCTENALFCSLGRCATERQHGQIVDRLCRFIVFRERSLHVMLFLIVNRKQSGYTVNIIQPHFSFFTLVCPNDEDLDNKQSFVVLSTCHASIPAETGLWK